MSANFIQPIRFGDPLVPLKNPFNINRKNHLDETLISRKFPSKGASAADYLQFIDQYVPRELISQQNFSEITKLANILTGNLTSFLIFESHLGNSNAQTDYCFAVSSMNGERERLRNLIKNRALHNTFQNHSVWKQIENFVNVWTEINSELNNKILGTWFEFDTSDSLSEHFIPSIFIQPLPISATSTKKSSKFNWLINNTIPLLLGRNLSKNTKKQLINCIQMLPKDASIFQIGTMLSRKNKSIRLVIKRIDISQIIPYLTSIGWSDNIEELQSLLMELNNYVNRIVLHIGIGEQIDSEIGIECSFYPDQYHQEKRWFDFLNYLRIKGLCHPKKQSALINYIGIGKIDDNYEYDPDNCIPSVMISDWGVSRALIRYISHIKIIYKSNGPIEAKAYAALRHFGCPSRSLNHTTQLVIEK